MKYKKATKNDSIKRNNSIKRKIFYLYRSTITEKTRKQRTNIMVNLWQKEANRKLIYLKIQEKQNNALQNINSPSKIWGLLDF